MDTKQFIESLNSCKTLFEVARDLVYSLPYADGEDAREEILSRIDTIIGLMDSAGDTEVTHFKGGKYEILAVGKDSTNNAPVVVYIALYGDNTIWTRPLEEFFGYAINAEGVGVKRFFQEENKLEVEYEKI